MRYIAIMSITTLVFSACAQEALPTTPTTPDIESEASVNQELSEGQTVLTNEDLIALADDKYADGEVPLGDGKYTLDGPKKSYIYYCNQLPSGNGAEVDGPWIKDNTWNFKEKISISGNKTWTDAVFENIIANGQRNLSGNGLPINHPTGTFPISSSEEGYQYDRNPNSISESEIALTLPENPTYSQEPYCLPTGEVGVMLSGVRLFDGMDAAFRDAPAHEIQDSCDGHPQEHGTYHYHSLSSCFEDTSVKTVLGYAYDGFPITGPMVTETTYLTTEDLDECHGITSEITDENGKTYTTYHYVMTYDFPYSIGCYRSEPTTTKPSSSNQKGQLPPKRP